MTSETTIPPIPIAINNHLGRSRRILQWDNVAVNHSSERSIIQKPFG
jgi:hypothetical protein